MQLPDFDQFEPLLELRRQMDAKKLGHFELFDPASGAKPLDGSATDLLLREKTSVQNSIEMTKNLIRYVLNVV